MNFVMKNHDFQATYLETNLCSNGLHRPKSRILYVVSPCGQSGIPIGLFLSTSASPLSYLSGNIHHQIPAATTNALNSERTQFY